MAEESSALRRLLRTQLTAVNQQFVHMLALRSFGETTVANRIDAVDRVDFPVSMKLMDYLVERRAPLDLEFRGFTPGETVEDICAAEIRMEQDMDACLAIRLDGRHPAARWLEDARRARIGYSDWLAARVATPRILESDNAVDGSAVNAMFAHLIALVEQAMAHAFVHWHRGDARDADLAWAMSGVAMMKSGMLVRAMATTGETPKAPASARLFISEESKDAFERDRRLAGACAKAAARAAEATTGKVARFCGDIEIFMRQASEHRNGDHPSVAAASPAFDSFEKTLGKYVH